MIFLIFHPWQNSTNIFIFLNFCIIGKLSSSSFQNFLVLIECVKISLGASKEFNNLCCTDC